VRNRSDGFRASYPNERGDELADILAQAAMRFEQGARPPLQTAFDALQRRPTADTLAGLEAAVADYQRDLAPASALAPGVGIDAATLLGQMKTDRIVRVSVTQQPVGERVEVGRLVAPGQCQSQQTFALFTEDDVCVRVFRIPPPVPLAPIRPDDPAQRERTEAEGSGWLRLLSDIFDRFFGQRDGEVPSGEVYSVPLQDLLRSGTWHSSDKRIALRATIAWPSLDEFRR
jgi:hypothetical protein